MKSIMKFLFLFIGLSAVVLVYKEELLKFYSPQSVPELISSSFEEDIKFMKDRKYLPALWDDIKEVKFSGTSTTSTEWINNSKPRINTKADGKYLLEYVLIDDNDAAMVQLNILDIQSGNKVWELNRVYPINDSDSVVNE